MKHFAQLYIRLDQTTSTLRKVDALVDYFQEAIPEDAVWAVSLLIGRRPKRLIPARKLQAWAAELADIPEWLFQASYEIVGDLAETITLVLPSATEGNDRHLHEWVTQHILPLRGKDEQSQQLAVTEAWKALDASQRFVFNKVITGAFRVGVSRKLVVRALSKASGLDPAVIAHRLMGHWEPTADFFNALLSDNTADADISRPYPFFLAYPLDSRPEELGDITSWQIEWKWDGIRAQVIQRRGQVFIWTRGEELVTDRFPEIADMAASLPPGTAIDGELVGWHNGRPLDFGALQKRIGRKSLTSKILSEVPVRMVAYDLLELNGEDLRQHPLSKRRALLTQLTSALSTSALMTSPEVAVNSWNALATARSTARSRGVEGLMIKDLASQYGVGRKKGVWWKWKVDPYRVDAVMIYAQKGHGRRSGLFTDYTLAVWKGDALVPFAKAYSGLSDQEIGQVDRFVQRNTLERFGPVRSVKPELVFEIAFEGIRPSRRHKSGVAVRFPRIARWRKDKNPTDADTIETVKALLSEATK